MLADELVMYNYPSFTDTRKALNVMHIRNGGKKHESDRNCQKNR